MTFVDWSDAGGLLDLLVEFVRDEKNDCRGDDERERFLARLISKISAVNEQLPVVGLQDTIVQLQSLYDSVEPEFSDDAVITHISACIEELDRINHSGA